MQTIQLKGIQTHNLKNISCQIPIGQLTAVTGISGSGKTSLVFHTLYAESYRRYLESLSSYARQFLKAIPKPVIEEIVHLPPAIGIQAARGGGHGHRSTVGTMSETYGALEWIFAHFGQIVCHGCSALIREPGAMVLKEFFDQNPMKGPYIIAVPLKKWPNPDFLLELGFAQTIDAKGQKGLLEKATQKTLKSGYLIVDEVWDPAATVSINQLWLTAQRLSSGQVWIFYGPKHSQRQALSTVLRCWNCQKDYQKPIPELFSFSHPLGACETCQGAGLQWLSIKEKIVCQTCHGKRLNSGALAVKVQQKNFYEVGQLSIGELQIWLKGLDKSDFEAISDLETRLSYLKDVGLDYLHLNRVTKTLSGGELQRIHMARSLGGTLTQTLFCLDEPSSGLHPQDRKNLLDVLKRMRDDGNTIVVVEHHPDLLSRVDHLMVLGPQAGTLGGQLTYEGKPSQLVISQLAWDLKANQKPREPKGFLELKKASTHTLKGINVSFPLECLIGVCGVSGSGKTSLVCQSLLPAWESRSSNLSGDVAQIESMLWISQNSLRRSSRSTIGTYLGLMTRIREIYSQTPKAKALKLSSRDFSFNAKGGRCERCHGLGTVTEDLSFLGDVDLVCPECQGQRFKPEVLSVTTYGIPFRDLFSATIAQIKDWFAEETLIQRICEPIMALGLGYLTLGQKTSSFSGGEAQRLKLLSLLKEANQAKKSFFILDEPSSGLSDWDVKKLYHQLTHLVALGHTVVVIEHHIGLLSQVDWLIEMGPCGGPKGGDILYQGPLSGIFDCPISQTAHFLETYL